MSGLWEDIKNAYFSYNGMGTNVFFLFVAIFYFLIINKKRQRNLLIYEIFGILLLVTPFIGNKIITLGAVEDSNWPVYGILCAIPLTAYVATEMFFETKNKKEKYGFLAVFLIVMLLGL